MLHPSHHSAIQVRLSKTLPRDICPCCVGPMYPVGEADKIGGPKRTRGHLVPSTYRGTRFWIWQCARCNADQDCLSIVEWSDLLAEVGDHRAASVAALVDALHKDGILRLML